MFTPRLITAPLSTVISLSEAKLFLSIDDQSNVYDPLLSMLIKTATHRIEQYTQRGLVTQTWQLNSDRVPSNVVELPMAGPLASITSVTYTDASNITTTVSADLYTADVDALPGRLILKPTSSWPSVDLYPGSGFRIRYVVGTDVADVPEIFKTAITFYTGFLFENRDADPKLPKVIQDLLYTHRITSPVPVLWGI